MVISEIEEGLNSFLPIDLDEMENVRLMNRTDTKYVLSLRRVPDLFKRLYDCYKILDINDIRSFSYSTTYLDSDDYLFYNQHINGKLERNKVRYRKYEVTGATFLEVKRRTNKNRTIKFRIENNLNPDSTCDDVALKFLKEYITQSPLFIKPVLINRFKRVTLVGIKLNERVTIDYDLSFSKPDGIQSILPFIAIIELKNEGNPNGSYMAKILKDSFIHQTGFSKYCIGTSILYNFPKYNIIKKKHLLIKKLENEFNKHLCS
jgi:hypothetical protein